MKTRTWKRFLSLLLALALIAPTVLSVVPEMVPTVRAASWIDAGGQTSGREGQLINGIYEIHVPNTDWVVGIENIADNRALHLLNDNTTNPDLQRWIIEYGGSYDKDGDGTAESHWYTVRNVATGMLLSQDSNYFHKTMSSTADANYQRWRIVYDTESKTYAIESWGQYINGWAGYMTPVVKVSNSTADTYDDSTPSVEYWAYLAGKASPFGFELKRVTVQNYSESYQLSYGTYRVNDSSGNRWTSITASPDEPAGADGLGYRYSELTNGTQLYQVDWTSAGYVTIFDAYTGRYIGDRNGSSTAYSGAIAQLEDDPTNWFDDRLRFYWIPIPTYASDFTLQSSYYLCNVLTGNCLHLVPSTGEITEVVGGEAYNLVGTIRNSRTTKTAWTFTRLDAYSIAVNGMNQGYNGSTGVYLDSFNHEDTIRLPIKIYDYLNDGMLFEYAQTNAGGSTSTDDNDYLYFNNLTYKAGNNLAFSLLTGSGGGEWNGRGGNYYTKLDPSYGSVAGDGNNPGAWNTYKTFSVGRMWFKYSDSNGWYSSDKSSSTNNYYWEKYGIGDFRGSYYNNPSVTYTVPSGDTASVYLIYGLNRDYPQGLNKDTVDTYENAANTFGRWDAGGDGTRLWSGDTTLTGSGTSFSLSYGGYQYDLYGYLAGTATIGLVKPQLNELTNAPEYRDVVVEYLADLLIKALSVPRTNPNNSSEYAYNYVSGAIHDRYLKWNGEERDLAEWLRQRLGYYSTWDVGTYARTYAKRDQLIGTWEKCSPNIDTVCDAAYFMLNNLFVAGSYNEPQYMFDYLELTNVKTDDSDGNIVDAYVFDSGFTTKGTGSNSETAVYYDTVNKVIKNTQVTGKANHIFSYSTSTAPVNYACAHPFLPVWEEGFNTATQTGSQADTESPYFNDDGVINSADTPATYEDRNFNYVLVSNGEFQYSHDEELFFNFEGDDDVYLFINGQLVLDIGGAHGIAGFRINLNDYVDVARANVAAGSRNQRDLALALADGGIYSFDFYYMERHGWGSNMRIVTNIRVVEKGMLVSKDGAQLGADLNTNDIINPDEPVEYTFTLTNGGTTDLIHPTFTDSDIGITISYSQGLVIAGGANGVTLFDKNGEALDVWDLEVTYTNPKTGTATTRTFATNDELIHYLKDELVIETQMGATPPCGVLTIGGIYYKLTADQLEAGVFRNQVNVTAYIRNDESSATHTNTPTSDDPVTVTHTNSGFHDGGPIENDFVFTNDGDTPRIHPTFSDPDKGLNISPGGGLQITEDSPAVNQDGEPLDVSDLVFTYTEPDGTKTTYTFTSNEELMDYLQNELVVEPGGTLTVEGIYYKPTTDEIETGKFENTIDITTYERDETASGEPSNIPTVNDPLRDSAEFTVYVPTRPLYYHWRNNALTISKSVLLEDVYTAANNDDNPLSNMVEHTITGFNSVAVSDYQTITLADGELSVDGNMNVIANFQTTGVKMVYLDINYTYSYNDTTRTATATIPVQIFVLDVQTQVYVLDYGLKVQLTFKDLFDSDTCTVAGRTTVFEILGIANENNVPTYGGNNITFTKETGFTIASTTGSAEVSDTYNGKFEVNATAADTQVMLTYTPEDFMDQRDDIYIAVRVREASIASDATIGTTDIRNEVEMFKKITVLPANVVYYEDNFTALDYQVSTDGIFTPNAPDLIQSADQDEQYGHDNVYADDTDVAMSGGSIATVTITNAYTEVVKFAFKGTGFEMISRTNAYDSATVEVAVKNLATGKISYYPVITEFEQTTTGQGGFESVYQVPVFRLDGLDYGSYEVTISGIPTVTGVTDGVVNYKTTYLYIDGIRIYNPMDTDPVAEYGQEDGATFDELRDLVMNDQSAVISLDTTDADETPNLTGTFGHISFAEDRNGWFNTNAGGLEQFAVAGPNNEVYLNGNSNIYAVVLYVKETAGTQGLLHIGVHDLYDGEFYGIQGSNDASTIRYWQNDQTWSSAINIGKTGTEQYYAIDYRACETVEDSTGTYYKVIIQVASGMVSFTNVKSVGLTFGTLDSVSSTVRYKLIDGVLHKANIIDGAIETDEEGNEIWIMVVNGLTRSLFSLRRVLTTDGTDTPEITLPEESSPEMHFNSASLSLAGDIGLNYYVTLSDDLLADPATRMVFTYGGKNQTMYLSDAADSEYGILFTCKLWATEMTQTVTAQLYNADGAVGESKVLSAKSYCDTVFAYAQTNADYAAVVPLLRSMLNYGAAAQTMFTADTAEALANAGLADSDKILPTVPDMSAYKPVVSGSEDGIRAAGACLLLDSTTTIRFFFTLTGSQTIDAYTFTVDGQVLEPVAADGQYYVDIVGIIATELDTAYELNVGGLTVSYSAMSYVYQVQKLASADDALKDLSAALWAYCQEANSYFPTGDEEESL